MSNAISPRPEPPYEPERQIAIEEQSLARHIEWNRHADTKTSFVFAAATGMLGTLAAGLPPLSDLTDWQWAALALSALPLAVSLLLCVAATFPQTRGPRSLLFFGDIASRELKEYQLAVRARSAEDYLLDLTAQCHRNSQIAASKYAHVRRAIKALFLSVVPWLVTIWMFY